MAGQLSNTAAQNSPYVAGLLGEAVEPALDGTITYQFLETTPAGLSAADNYYPWFSYEISAVEQAFETWSNVANIKFVELTTPGSSPELELSLTDNDSFLLDGALGGFLPAFQDFPGLGLFNIEGPGWTQAGLNQGGGGFVVLIHEIGHSLGLEHPHEDEGGSSIFPGVDSPFELGDFELNQGVWTTMTYNNGFVANGLTLASGYGYEGTPMAFDIAAIQALYGPNMSYNTGDDTYSLPTANVSGTYYSSIWDAGGIDTISAGFETLGNATINLNEAPLEGPNAGGYISSVEGIYGGFTIANGVVIENAIGGSGDDFITGNAASNILDGWSGNDILFGEAGDDTLWGYSGNDFLDGGSGNDLINGESGDDFLDGWTGDDILNGGSGEDVLYGYQGDDQLNGGSGDDKLYGELGNDLLEGNAGHDLLKGGDGDDQLSGGAGNDNLKGQDGKDVLDGGLGDDNLHGGDGDDWLDGGLGNDFLEGGKGNDIVLGFDGDDSLYGYGGDDSLYGEAGHDLLNGAEGNDFLDGGAGNDTLVGAKGDDLLLGADGDDKLSGNVDNDELYGEAGDDELNGGAGHDYLSGGTGNDFLDGWFGNDFLAGGTGNDIVWGHDGDDFLYGESGNDYLKGGLGDDFLDGGLGNDQLKGSAGNDVLFGNFGNDILFGGGDQDTFLYLSGDGADVIKDFGGVGQGGIVDSALIPEIDTLQFSGSGFTAENMILTQVGADLLISFEGAALSTDTVLLKNFDLENLDNLPSFETDIAPLGNILFDSQTEIQDDFDVFDADMQLAQVINRDTVTFLNDADNHVYGFAQSDDVINGQGGADSLVGLSGDDLLRGGAGNDTLVGGAGFDVLQGDAGSDRFILTVGQGLDWITDFDLTQDWIGLTDGLSFSSLSLGQVDEAAITGTLLTHQSTGENIAFLQDVTADSLSQSHFVMA